MAYPALSRMFRSFRQDKHGNIAIITAVSMTVMAGAVGFGMDTMRQQNALSELQHVVTLVCERVAEVQTAQYPTPETRITLGNQYSAELIKNTSLVPSDTTVTITIDSAVKNVTVYGSTVIDTSFMKILDIDKMNAAAKKICPISGGPDNVLPQCKGNAMQFTNLTPDEFNDQLDDFINRTSTKSYIISVYNPVLVKQEDLGNSIKLTYDMNIKVSSIVKVGSTIGSFIANTGYTASPIDIVIMQEFNGDSTIAKRCTPSPYLIFKKIPDPPPYIPQCVDQWTSDPSMLDRDNQSFHDIVVKQNGYVVIDPTKIAVSLNKYPVPGVSFTVSNSNSLPKVPIYGTRPYDWQKGGKHGVANSQLKWSATFYNSFAKFDGTALTNYDSSLSGDYVAVALMLYRGWHLFAIKNELKSLWFQDDNCMEVQSPIVLDLTGQGRIATTGETTAPNLIRHHVGQTVSFDMSGNGRPVQTEWLKGAGQGLLVDNRDGRAASNMSGRRLFGDVDGFANGYEKLATFDTSHTGVLKGHDLDGLMVWIDNGNAIVEPGEMKTLAEVGVTEISAVPSIIDGRKGEKFIRSWAVRNGMPIMTEDVWFAQAPVLTGQK